VFADGFAGKDPIESASDVDFRPMGLAVGPEGSLYVTDSKKGKIWRIMYKGDKNNFAAAALAAMEKRKALPHLRTPDEIKDNLYKGKVVPGEKVYTTYCSSCHQRNGKGDGNRFPPLAGSEWVNGDKKRLMKVVLNGLNEQIEVMGKPYNSLMPQHSFLKDEELAEVLTYVRTNFGNKSTPITVSDIKSARKARNPERGGNR
jgi:mono/diheme cytochrome c family protein